MKSNHWTRENIVWLAAYLEGEGTFLIRKVDRHKNTLPRINVAVASTDRDIIEKVRWIVGAGTIIKITKDKRRPERIKDQWRWTSNGSDLSYAVIAAIYQFMGLRRKSRITELMNCYKTIRQFKVYGDAFGERKRIGAWIKDSRCCVPKSTVWSRVWGGWDIERAITQPGRRFVSPSGPPPRNSEGNPT